MEGLIPMVYKAIKKNKTRRQYECLSSGACQSYNITDFYVNGQGHAAHKYNACMTPPQTDKIASHHRRHKSVENFSAGYSSADDWTNGTSIPTPKKLVRFGSHRMFSCVTGV